MRRYIPEVINYSLAVIGILSGAYFYFASVRERIPTFIVDPIKSTIVDKELIRNKPLKISDSEGKEILDNVNILTFYFFNQGNEPIKSENILSDLHLSLSSGSEILDYKILKASREVSKIRLFKKDSSKNSIFIDFKILEESDGFTSQIIYLGSKDSNLILTGDIEGVKSISSTLKRVNFGSLLLILVVVSYLGFSSYFFIKLKLRLTRPYQLVIRSEKHLAEKTVLTFTYAKLIVMLSTCFFLIFVSSLFLSKTLFSKWFDPKYKQSIKNEIPSEIFPDN
jgi:hypothetical protein